VIARVQKTRLARIHSAKVLANKTFLRGKQKAEAILLARESGLDNTEDLNDVDVFQLQHHHLLTCLERTTVSLVVPSSIIFDCLYVKKLIISLKMRPASLCVLLLIFAICLAPEQEQLKNKNSLNDILAARCRIVKYKDKCNYTKIQKKT